MTLFGLESYMIHWDRVESLKPNIRPGDIVEIKRDYIHAGIYTDDGMLVHISDVSSGGTTLKKLTVVEESLEGVAGEDRVRINNDDDRRFPPLPEEQIVERAKDFVGNVYRTDNLEQTGHYFVTLCRYGGSRVGLEGW